MAQVGVFRVNQLQRASDKESEPLNPQNLSHTGTGPHISSDYPMTREEPVDQSAADFPEADFWPASKSAIKCRIRSALTQAEAAIAIATSLHRETLADLSVQTGAGERIGDLPLVAKVARESTAKINCPTSRWRIENGSRRNPHSSGR